MIVWCIVGNEIGPNGNGALYCATKQEAEAARRTVGDQPRPDPPEKITIKTREQLAAALNDAMGFGAS